MIKILKTEIRLRVSFDSIVKFVFKFSDQAIEKAIVPSPRDTLSCSSMYDHHP